MSVKKCEKYENVGYQISFFGMVALLLWLGAYKFAPTEAKAIEPLVMNHPLSGWLYQIMSSQSVSNLVGSVEILVAIGLLLGLLKPRVGYWAAWVATIIFVVTLSFMFTTPNTFKVVDGIPITSFFLFKDVLFLGTALMTVAHMKARIVTPSV